MGTVISFLNMKGGVGKTTLCKEIGYYLFKEENQKVLFIDVDPQSNLTQSVFKRFGYRQKGETNDDESIILESASVNAVFNYTSNVEEVNYSDAIVDIKDEAARLSIIPGDLNTLFLERAIGGSEKEHSLKNFIEDFKLQEEFDYILLDCPPTYSFYTTAALLASDLYISPIKPDSYSVLGIDLLQQVVERLASTHRDRFRSRPIMNMGVIFSNIQIQPSVGVNKLIQDISDSTALEKHGIYFFNDKFITNPYIPQQIDYFINDNNSSKSIMNLSNIVVEFKERVLELCPESSSSELN